MTACLVEIATPWHASVISFQLAVSITMSRSIRVEGVGSAGKGMQTYAISCIQELAQV